MASFTYRAVGNKIDWTEIITNIDPSETVTYSMFGRGTAKGMTHNWLTDHLSVPGANKHLENAQLLIDEAVPRIQLSNNIQIFQSGYYVTDSQQAVDKVGIKDELSYQMTKCLKEIALDVEYAIVTNDSTALSGAATEGQMGGIPYFNTVNVINATAFTELSLNDAIHEAWKKGGKVDTVLLSGANKRIMSGFVTSVTKNMKDVDKKRVNVIDVYESDFGIVTAKAHRLYEDDRIDLIQSDLFRVFYLIPFHQEELPRTNLLRGKNINGQLTLECRSKDAHSVIKIAAAPPPTNP